MNLPKLSELSPYYNRTDLLEKVVEQVKKDFNCFSFDITFTNKAEQRGKFNRHVKIFIISYLNTKFL